MNSYVNDTIIFPNYAEHGVSILLHGFDEFMPCHFNSDFSFLYYNSHRS